MSDKRPMHEAVAMPVADGTTAEIIAAALAVYCSHLRRGMAGLMHGPGWHTTGVGVENVIESTEEMTRRLQHERWAARHGVAQDYLDQLYEAMHT